MRAHPLRTPGRDRPGKPAPERLRHAARVEIPGAVAQRATDPAALRSRAFSETTPPERQRFTPPGPRLPTPQRHPTPTAPHVSTGTRSHLFTRPKARPGTLPEIATKHPGTLQAPPSAPRHHTHQPRDSLRPLGKNARPSSPNTGTRTPRQTRARTLETRRARESPGAVARRATDPAALRSRAFSQATPPERRCFTPPGPRLPPPQKSPMPIEGNSRSL
jgi:hypothetical protein